jgi:hypothetical protein
VCRRYKWRWGQEYAYLASIASPDDNAGNAGESEHIRTVQAVSRERRREGERETEEAERRDEKGGKRSSQGIIVKKEWL